MNTTANASRIVAGAFIEAEKRYENASYSQAAPAVIYQARLDGAVTRVEREGYGDHLTLIRDRGVETIVASTGGVVGIIGYSHSANDWCVESTDGSLRFFARTRDEVIGTAGIAWIY